MSCCEEIHIDDVGTQFVVTIVDCDDVAVDISALSPYTITFAKPDGSTISRSASLYTDGTDGKITYTTTTGDIDTAGRWQIQGIVGGFHSSIGSFNVNRNL